MTEKSDEGRVARLSLAFVEAGENLYPSVSDDLTGQLIAEVDAATKAVTECFTDVFTVLNCPAFVLRAAQEKLSALMKQVQGFTGNSVPGNLFSLLQIPTALIGALSGIVPKRRINVIRILRPLPQNRLLPPRSAVPRLSCGVPCQTARLEIVQIAQLRHWG